jgi:citrate lyase beta subunit
MRYSENQLLRSILYVPASQEKVLKKAPTLGADALILDLEDSVPPQAKAQARILAQKSLLDIKVQQVLRTVRINALSTDLWIADSKTIFSGRPDGIVVPKVDRVEALLPLDAQLTDLEQDGGGYTCSIWAMIESPLGVVNAHAIACHPRVDCLVMGTSDLVAAMGVDVEVDRRNLAVVLQQAVLAAKAAGIPIIDGVFGDLKNSAGFEAQCREGAGLGFDGKTIIHPSQVEPANRLFLPSDSAVTNARRILFAWQEARGRGEEICLVDGVLVERLHARRALEILKSVNEILDSTDL